MRAVAISAIALSLALTGCWGARGADSPGGDDSPGPPLDGDRSCFTSTDCVAAGASCCGCAEYAVNTSSAFAQACEDVNCPPPDPGVCSSLVPVCGDDNQCTLGCPVISCTLTCEAGFVVDGAGCLTCECAAAANECGGDGDCARVAADCCGCALGGADTAVPADEADNFHDGLGCPPAPVCPGVDVCTPGDIARCAAGRCILAQPDPGVPAGTCGSPDFPACPPGQTCVLNSDDGATEQGLGICQ